MKAHTAHMRCCISTMHHSKSASKQKYWNAKMEMNWVIPQYQAHHHKSSYFLYVIFSLLLNVWKKWQGLFHNGAIISIFVAHLTAAQGAKTILELEVEGVKPAFPCSYGALVLCRAGVSQFTQLLVCYLNIGFFRSSTLYSSSWLRPSLLKLFVILASHPVHLWSPSTIWPVSSQPEELASMTHLGVNRPMGSSSLLSTNYNKRALTRLLQVPGKSPRRLTAPSVPKRSLTIHLTNLQRKLQCLLISHPMKKTARLLLSRMSLRKKIGTMMDIKMGTEMAQLFMRMKKGPNFHRLLSKNLAYLSI